MRWTERLTAGLVLVVLTTACEAPQRAETGPVYEDEGTVLPVLVLKSDTSRTPRGFLVAELDVLLPVGVSEATARASLQHVIDSVASADTLAAAVQVVGYVIGDFRPALGTADLEPGLRATWAPIDTAGITGARRRSRFRTDFVVVKPFGTPAPPRRTP